MYLICLIQIIRGAEPVAQVEGRRAGHLRHAALRLRGGGGAAAPGGNRPGRAVQVRNHVSISTNII